MHTEEHTEQGEHPEDDGYRGQGTLVVDGRELAVTVELRGHFQPIDGYYRWYGRIAANPELSELVAGRRTTAELRTPGGSATGELSDPDPWDRYRIMGTSTPPFVVQTSVDVLEI